MYAFFSLIFPCTIFPVCTLPTPHNFSNRRSLKNYYYISLTVYCIFFFRQLALMSTQDTADVKQQPHVHLVSTIVNYFRRCSIAMVMFFLLTGGPVASPV